MDSTKILAEINEHVNIAGPITPEWHEKLKTLITNYEGIEFYRSAIDVVSARKYMDRGIPIKSLPTQFKCTPKSVPLWEKKAGRELFWETAYGSCVPRSLYDERIDGRVSYVVPPP